MMNVIERRKSDKRPKSVALSKSELKALQQLVKSNTQEVVADRIGISRGTLQRLLLAGSGSYETVWLIKKFLQ